MSAPTGGGFSLDLNAADVRHAMKFASRDLWRPMLRGVLIEPSGVMVATNGHILMAITPETGGPRPPREVVLSFKAVPKSCTSILVDIPAEPSARPLVCEFLSVAKKKFSPTIRSFGLVDEIAGKFPNWRNVVPKQEDLHEGMPIPTVNGEYVERFRSGVNGGIRLCAQRKPDSAIVVTCMNPRYFGVLMPLRNVDRPMGAPIIPHLVRTAPVAAELESAA